jgi:5'-phosphate synthase pdxT subunit
MKVGVVAVQGAVSEHLCAFEAAFRSSGVSGCAVAVRRPAEMRAVDALALPGGESTAISKLLVQSGLFDSIGSRAREGMPLMGTCAGLVLMASEGDGQVSDTGTRLLGLMDMRVKRNAFGRQRESFEAMVKVSGISGGSFPAVFIRAPSIESAGARCRPIAAYEGTMVGARQGAMLALAFHPELSGDTRIHEAFIKMI